MFKNHNVLGFCLTLALFAGSANAQELLGTTVGCEAIGVPRICVPQFGELFFTSFVIADDRDPLFTITAGTTAITLTMDAGVTGNDLAETGFRLTGLLTTPDGTFIAPIQSGDVEYLGNWPSKPAILPVVSGDQPPYVLEWTSLAGADPVGEAAIRINLVFGGGLPSGPVDLSGAVEDAGGTPLCALVLASGQFMFSCNPNGPFSLTDLPREADGSVKRQVYADGFFPNVETLTGSADDTVTMTRAGTCPDYNAFPEPGVFPDSASKWINVSGTVLLQNSDTPVCAMVLGNGQFDFTCDGTGAYSGTIPLDANGQYKLQVYAQGFAPMIKRFDEFTPDVEVRLARDVECSN